MSGVPAFFPEYQAKVASALRHRLTASGGRVEQAMAYTALAPSKQVRAVLVMLCAELCRGNIDRAVPAACAIELVHASSLILDDLPSMDDASLRRGRSANHVVFGEAIAILAAFGLLNHAFGTLATAIEAVRAGAFDYISKPFDIGEITKTVQRALDQTGPRQVVTTPAVDVPSGELIGRTPAMLAVYNQIARAADSVVPVLIVGGSLVGLSTSLLLASMGVPSTSRFMVASANRRLFSVSEQKARRAPRRRILNEPCRSCLDAISMAGSTSMA